MAISKKRSFVPKPFVAGELSSAVRDTINQFSTAPDSARIQFTQGLPDGSSHTRYNIAFADLDTVCAFGDKFDLIAMFNSDVGHGLWFHIDRSFEKGKMDVYASGETGGDVAKLLDELIGRLGMPETSSHQGNDQVSLAQAPDRMAIIKRSTSHTEWIRGTELYLDDLKLIEQVLSTYGQRVEVFNQEYEFGSVDALTRLGAVKIEDIILSSKDPKVDVSVTGSMVRLNRGDASEKALDLLDRVRTLLLERRSFWLWYGVTVFSAIMGLLIFGCMSIALSMHSLFWVLFGLILTSSLALTSVLSTRRSKIAVHLTSRSVRESVIKVYIMPIALSIISGLLLALAKQYLGLK